MKMQPFIPFAEEKCWGRVTHIFANPHAAVSCLEVERGFCCSKHYHRDRANLFAVQEGSVVIEEWPDGLESKSKLILLGPGDTYYVPSGIWHRFRVWRTGRLTEVYWPDRPGGEVDPNDIERADMGGSDDLEALRAELVSAGLL